METAKKINHKDFITEQIRVSAEVLQGLSALSGDIERLADALIAAFRAGKKVVFFGNGGSAADAQHLATELVGGFTNHDRPGLPALALTTDTSALTSIGNDHGFAEVFARQAEALLTQGDVAVALSTSGNSPNVLRGAEAAKAKGALVVGLTGGAGGRLAGLSDFCIAVPSTSTAHIQQAHIAIGHIVCALVEKELF